MKKKIFYLSLILLLIDQISKALVAYYFEVGESKVIIDNFFSLTYIKNSGAAWGMFAGGTIFLAIVSILFLGFIISSIKKMEDVTTFNVITYSLIISGIIGNMIDRIVRGSVIDFFNFYIFGYDYPVFNIADIFIVVGIILIVIESFWAGDKIDSK